MTRTTANSEYLARAKRLLSGAAMIIVQADAKPRLARRVRLSENPVRGGWNILAPEHVLMANGAKPEILKLCDGALLADLSSKRMVEL